MPRLTHYMFVVFIAANHAQYTRFIEHVDRFSVPLFV
jgi:hypothetical protein